MLHAPVRQVRRPCATKSGMSVVTEPQIVTSPAPATPRVRDPHLYLLAIGNTREACGSSIAFLEGLLTVSADRDCGRTQCAAVVTSRMVWRYRNENAPCAHDQAKSETVLAGFQ